MLSGIEFAPLRFFLVGAVIIVCFQVITDTVHLLQANIVTKKLGCLGVILYGGIQALSIAALGKIAAWLL